MEAAFGGTVFIEFCRLPAKTKVAQSQLTLVLSLLSRHHPDAQVALQQSPTLQGDIYKLMKDRMKIKAEV